MSRRTRRTERVDELLKQEIARVIRDLKDPRVGFATVMDVRTSPDLRHARVYVSVLGEESARRAAIEALEGARGFVRARIGEAVTLKTFAVIVMGGMGNVKGTLLGGWLLGIVESLVAGFVGMQYRDAVGFAALIAILMWRPWGFFAVRGRF